MISPSANPINTPKPTQSTLHVRAALLLYRPLQIKGKRVLVSSLLSGRAKGFS